jgi:hypothetical protein
LEQYKVNQSDVLFVNIIISQEAHNLKGENLKVVWAEFYTLSSAVFLLGKILHVANAQPWPKLGPGFVLA